VANGKKISVKLPVSIQLLKKELKISFPQTQVIARWGTWLDATVCYAENFYVLCSVVDELHTRNIFSTVEL
jgi:hypothetical protein